MRKIKEPSVQDASLCMEYRKQSKLGRPLSEEARAFCDRMYREYTKWYEQTQRQVFVDTAPFGSIIS